jgi:hypothetical protein
VLLLRELVQQTAVLLRELVEQTVLLLVLEPPSEVGRSRGKLSALGLVPVAVVLW